MLQLLAPWPVNYLADNLIANLYLYSTVAIGTAHMCTSHTHTQVSVHAFQHTRTYIYSPRSFVPPPPPHTLPAQVTDFGTPYQIAHDQAQHCCNRNRSSLHSEPKQHCKAYSPLRCMAAVCLAWSMTFQLDLILPGKQITCQIPSKKKSLFNNMKDWVIHTQKRLD